MANALGGIFKSPVENACNSFDDSYRKYTNPSLSSDEREKARKAAGYWLGQVKKYRTVGGNNWLANDPALKSRVEAVIAKEMKLVTPAPIQKKEEVKPANPFAAPTPVETQKPKEKQLEAKPTEKKVVAKKKTPKTEVKAIEAPAETKAAKIRRLEAQIGELKHLDSRYYISPVSYMRAKFKPDDGQLKDLAHAGVNLKKGEKYSRNEIREAIHKELDKVENELNKLKPAALKHVVADARELAGDAKYEYLMQKAREKKAAELKTQKPVKTEKKPEEKIYAGYARYEHLMEEARKKKAKEESAK